MPGIVSNIRSISARTTAPAVSARTRFSSHRFAIAGRRATGTLDSSRLSSRPIKMAGQCSEPGQRTFDLFQALIKGYQTVDRDQKLYSCKKSSAALRQLFKVLPRLAVVTSQARPQTSGNYNLLQATHTLPEGQRLIVSRCCLLRRAWHRLRIDFDG